MKLLLIAFLSTSVLAVNTLQATTFTCKTKSIAYAEWTFEFNTDTTLRFFDNDSWSNYNFTKALETSPVTYYYEIDTELNTKIQYNANKTKVKKATMSIMENGVFTNFVLKCTKN